MLRGIRVQPERSGDLGHGSEYGRKISYVSVRYSGYHFRVIVVFVVLYFYMVDEIHRRIGKYGRQSVSLIQEKLR